MYTVLSGASSSNLSGTKKASKDPFEKAKLQIENEISDFSLKFDDWKHLLNTTNTAQNKEFYNLTQELKEKYKDIKLTLKYTENATIKQVKNNKLMFLNITNEMLNNRQLWLNNMFREIESIKNDISSKKNQTIILKHKNELLRQQKDTNFAVEIKTNESIKRNNEKIRNFKQILNDEKEEQNEILDDMIDTLKRLGVQGNDILVELNDQNELLDEVEVEMDRGLSKLDILTNKLDKLMNHSNKKKYCLIFVLLVILFVMVFYMFQS